MDELRGALGRVVDEIVEYRSGLAQSRVAPSAERAEIRASLIREVPEVGLDIGQVTGELIERAGPGLMASAGPRYFGFVIGGSSDAALAADILTSG